MRHEPENEYDRMIREEKLEEIARDCRDALEAVRRMMADSFEPPRPRYGQMEERARA